jgi:hypothetical protein
LDTVLLASSSTFYHNFSTSLGNFRELWAAFLLAARRRCSSWASEMDSLASNTKVQFAATAIVSAAVAATAILSLQKLRQEERYPPKPSNSVTANDADAPPKV